MISIIFIFYLLLATCFSKSDRLTTNVSPSLNDLNLLKKPLNLYITANGVHAVVRNEVRLVEVTFLHLLSKQSGRTVDILANGKSAITWKCYEVERGGDGSFEASV